jgi:hypothetical protein
VAHLLEFMDFVWIDALFKRDQTGGISSQNIKTWCIESFKKEKEK